MSDLSGFVLHQLEVGRQPTHLLSKHTLLLAAEANCHSLDLVVHERPRLGDDVCSGHGQAKQDDSTIVRALMPADEPALFQSSRELGERGTGNAKFGSDLVAFKLTSNPDRPQRNERCERQVGLSKRATLDHLFHQRVHRDEIAGDVVRRNINIEIFREFDSTLLKRSRSRDFGVRCVGHAGHSTVSTLKFANSPGRTKAHTAAEEQNHD